MSNIQDPVQAMLISEFRAKWAKNVDAVELGSHEIEEEGVYFEGKLYDPFAGTTVGNAYFSWDEIIGAISGREDFFMLKEEAAMNICESGETFGSAELVMDDDGRVHFVSELDDD
jgi:hypothetical protein